MFGKLSNFTIRLMATIFVSTILFFGSHATACPTYSLYDIASAIKNSSAAADSIRQKSCMWGGRC